MSELCISLPESGEGIERATYARHPNQDAEPSQANLYVAEDREIRSDQPLHDEGEKETVRAAWLAHTASTVNSGLATDLAMVSLSTTNTRAIAMLTGVMQMKNMVNVRHHNGYSLRISVAEPAVMPASSKLIGAETARADRHCVEPNFTKPKVGTGLRGICSSSVDNGT